MNYIKIIQAPTTQDAEDQVNLFLANTKDKVLDVKLRLGEAGSVVTLVMGTFSKFRIRKFEFIECDQDADEINSAISHWSQANAFRRHLDDIVVINGEDKVFLKMIFTEKDQIRNRSFNINR